MTLVDFKHAEMLLALAQDRFDLELLETEKAVLIHCAKFEDPPEPEGRGPRVQDKTEIRSAFLRWLVTDRDAALLVEHRGIRVWNATFSEPLDLRGCRVMSRLEFRYCTFKAEVNMISAEALSLYIMHCNIEGPLEAARISLRGPLFLSDITSSAPLDFGLATIDGEVSISETRIIQASTQDSSSEYALRLNGIKIRSSLWITGAFEANCETRVHDAEIGGSFRLRGSKLNAPRVSLSVIGTTIARDFDLSDHVEAAGLVAILDTKVGGDLFLRGAVLNGADTSLNLSNSVITGSVYLNEGFRAAGTIIARGIEIGDDLNCQGAQCNDHEIALTCEQSHIRRFVLLNKGFVALGKVNFSWTVIGHAITCWGASMPSFIGGNMKLGGELIWQEIKGSDKTKLDLSGASIGRLLDDSKSWPAEGNLFVNGLCLGDIVDGSSVSSLVHERTKWLNLQNESNRVDPQPWLQFAKILEDKGLKQDAKRALFELHKHQAHAQWKNHSMLRRGAILFAQLEEQPGRILISIVAFVVLGTAVFWPLKSHFSETSTTAYVATHQNDEKAKREKPAYPVFQPVMYSLENLLPFVKLGQDDKWAPDYRSGIGVYWLLTTIRWMLILAGWVQGLILAAAVGGRFKN